MTYSKLLRIVLSVVCMFSGGALLAPAGLLNVFVAVGLIIVGYELSK